MNGAPRIVVVLGAGAIGSGWAALFASRGAVARIVDPDPAARQRARDALECARSLSPADDRGGAVEWSAELAEALPGAQWVQESLPESLPHKRELLGRLAGHLDPRAIVASSTSTFTPTELSATLPFAGRFLVVHPLHPVYAVPVVEMCPGPRTAADTIARARDALRAIGREPVLVHGEAPGLVSNRLTAALLREAIDLVARGIVSADELDRVVARGIALGWATVGPLRTEAMGSGSVETFVERLADPLTRVWASLAGWQELDAERRATVIRAAGIEPGPSDECEWARTLSRLLAAAAPRR